ncbi:cytochrome c-type biogenesis protein CcmH [Tateyamaria omphalii]|uniref:cytochrome c-type biogenesis protein n=1 Tax=Tateyamaria omphalii TaxID=299262 RepID=UPI001C9A102E|nr:cytochrome c-type biogenesis protein [Tateyamaria omphalii]MBY5932316.1 cytochrome c-type biogenesis protein CcmH [Tateyamaria omphalii]
MKRLAILFSLILSTAAFALDPSEMLDDPALEAKARELDHALRCVVCQSEAVASSNAQWAVDARRVIREQIAAGQTQEQVVDFFVERYGEFVLMTPRVSGSNWMLWAAGPLMFLLAIGIGIGYLRGRSRAPVTTDAGLSEAETRRLREIMDE